MRSTANQVPGSEWILPQPAITQETLTSYIDERMPPLDSSLCGCQDLPGYPELRGGKKSVLKTAAPAGTPGYPALAGVAGGNEEFSMWQTDNCASQRFRGCD